MNTPPLLLAITLLFWGWQTNLLPWAVMLAVALEASRLVAARWEFSQAELDRIWNLCILLCFGALVYAFTVSESGYVAAALSPIGARLRTQVLAKTVPSVFVFFQWMPLYFFPMMATQAWAQEDRIAFSTFSWWLRRNRRIREKSENLKSRGLPLRPAPSGAGAASAEGHLNVSYPYLALCLLGASAARARSPWFLAGLLLLLGWTFWARRSRGFSPIVWVGSILAASVLGLFVQRSLLTLQVVAQRLDSALVTRLSRGWSADAKESRTMLGSIGKLKLSGQIMLRVNSGDQPPPTLLREASYNLFKSPVWGSARRQFTPYFPEADERTWNLLTNQNAARSVRITGLLPAGKGVLALPQGTVQLEKLPVFILEHNRLGAVRSEAGPGFVEFTARYGGTAAIDEPPGIDDRQVPANEKPALAQIVSELKLEEQHPVEAVRALTAFFNRHFQYSTWLGNRSIRDGNQSPIAEFLLRRRKGHCEYFASATALLLRQAGIPARYAVGYSVQERKGGEYIVRQRHAHAWCLAWVNGAWREVDTTPGSWTEVEASHASFWEPISDAWSRFRFGFSKWRWSQAQWRKYLFGAIGLLLLAGIARLIAASKGCRARTSPAASRPSSVAGLDSEFYLIEHRLEQIGLVRERGETPFAWLRRISVHKSVRDRGLNQIVALHYKLRFDPAGISSTERADLGLQVRRWLQELSQK